MEFSKNPKPAILIKDTRGEINSEEKLKILETFEFESLHPQMIHIQTKEFSAVCPGTGLPDIGFLDIWYIPISKAVELKSLKYYLFSFRDDAIFQEPVTDVIFDHLWRLLDPKFLKIKMVYNTRGGFDTITTMQKGEKPEGY